MADLHRKPIIETFVLGPFATNCSIVRGADGAACWILDAGYAPGALIERVAELGLTPEAIVLTHAHADHIAGIEEVKKAFPAVPALLHETESGWLSDPELNLSASIGQAITAPPADRMLAGGETLQLAGCSWKVIHTPGHSPGGITLWCEQATIAFVGDTLFASSIGRYDFPTSDGPTLFHSIRNSLYTLPDQTAVHPGHGPATTIGVEKTSNPFVRA